MSRAAFTAMLAVMAHSVSAATVTFRVEPAAPSDTAQVFIVGNHDVLGDWNPGRVPLTRQPDGAWEADTVNYKVNGTLTRLMELAKELMKGEEEKKSSAPPPPPASCGR